MTDDEWLRGVGAMIQRATDTAIGFAVGFAVGFALAVLIGVMMR